MGELRVN